ncbi:hypothetical protein BJY24_002854 [Nocardia transvalensis]|uniref:Pentapeptide repeat protein n=1 Tax=Nocardia transvalensis TaxID=37333 RepID=A0A7W9PD54_9NOCA|nr:pentapeptide repeat-containing protein [Nocardia transvalensis]MBB5913987.1 hypothetical protein [Nocardia transvalensis]
MSRRPRTGARVTKAATRFGRITRRLGLLPAVLLAVSAGAAIALAAYWILRVVIHTSSAPAAPIDLTKLAFTVVGGIGGVVALVIAYRRQRDIEQGRFVERFGAAAAQLGSGDVAVRLAGVYAMAGAADESDGPRRQQCVDVLCGYLRLPYDVDHGSTGRTKLVTTTPRVERGRDRGTVEEHVEYRQNDREVRRTIVRVIIDRLRSDSEYDWSASDFDFRDAHLEESGFGSTTFGGSARFARATFAATADFRGATFTGAADFRNATFTDTAYFKNATFAGTTDFRDATFADTAYFKNATFTGPAHFRRSAFAAISYFRNATFSADTDFRSATFADTTYFRNGVFGGTADFTSTAFGGTADFTGTAFSATAYFGLTAFSGTAYFEDAEFTGDAHFTSAAFTATAYFAGTRFGSAASFLGTDFGSQRISFDGPGRWGAIAPRFDWDADPRTKPANVDLQDRPPPVSGQDTGLAPDAGNGRVGEPVGEGRQIG